MKKRNRWARRSSISTETDSPISWWRTATIWINAVTVFYNDKHGRFPETPSWSSGDLDYHTGVAAGDIDLDGWIDVAVMVGPSPQDTVDQGYAKVYFNRGGALEPLPSYRTADRYSSFGGALGDYDGDGDLDLAVAVAFEGAGSTITPSRLRIYRNDGGQLSPTPSWVSDARVYATNMKFADIDGDGLLDMAVAARALPIYRARLDKHGAVTLPTEPFWTAPLEVGLPLFIDVGPIGSSSSMGIVTSYNDAYDGVIPDDDLAINPPTRPRIPVEGNIYPTPPPRGSCAPGSGSAARLTAYTPLRGRDPIWVSDNVGWGSGVRLVDVSGDGALDLLATRWGPQFYGYGAPLEIYLGTAPAFEASAAFSSSTCTIGETIAVADLDRSDLLEKTETFVIKRPQAVVTLLHQVTAEVRGVQRNGAELGIGDYITVPGGNWVSFKERLMPSERVTVRYAYSNALDIVLTNTYSRNHIFYRRAGETGHEDGREATETVPRGSDNRH
jgi:VCBS repeat protein